MKKTRYSALGLLAVSLLVTNIGMAASSSPYELATRCGQVSYQLEQLANNNRNAPCVETVELSAVYMDTAAKNLIRHKAPQALMYLNFASKEMNDMSMRPQCAYLALRTNSYISTVYQLKVEVEMLDPYQVAKQVKGN